MLQYSSIIVPVPNVRCLVSIRSILPAIVAEVASVPEVAAELRAGTTMAATGGIGGVCRQWHGDRP